MKSKNRRVSTFFWTAFSTASSFLRSTSSSVMRFFSSAIDTLESASLATVRRVSFPCRRSECFAEKKPLSPRLFVTFVAF
jgi:hypothetical protein